jgi:hypothetical protein
MRDKGERESLCGEDVDVNLGRVGGLGGPFFFIFWKKKKKRAKKLLFLVTG